MVESDSEMVTKDLNDKKEIVELRLKSIDKQEDNLREKATKLQEEVLQEMKEAFPWKIHNLHSVIQFRCFVLTISIIRIWYNVDII